MQKSEQSIPWTKYWEKNQTGNSFNSSGNSSIANYSKENEAFWKNTFRPINQDALIVDLATGNGALLKIANKINKKLNKKWKLIGVDMAKLSPSSDLLESVDFLEETDICNIPLEDNSVDVLVSQYGFEYAEPTRVVNEMRRVLKQDGYFIGVAHNSDSFVTKISILTVKAYNDMQNAGIFKLLEQPLTSSQFSSFQQNLIVKMKPILNVYSTTEIQSDVLKIMQKMAVIIKSVNQIGVIQVDALLSQLSENLQLHQVRLEQQISASLNQNKIRFLEDLARTHNLSFEANQKKFKLDDLTWVIKMTKEHD